MDAKNAFYEILDHCAQISHPIPKDHAYPYIGIEVHNEYYISSPQMLARFLTNGEKTYCELLKPGTEIKRMELTDKVLKALTTQ